MKGERAISDQNSQNILPMNFVEEPSAASIHVSSNAVSIAAPLTVKQVERQVIEIKKQQTDAMAGIIYSGGMSVVHVAMLCGMAFVRKPDLELAKKLD